MGRRMIGPALAALTLAALAAPQGAAARPHRGCHFEGNNPVELHGVICIEAYSVYIHMDCASPDRQVTPTEFIYTCDWQGWRRVERVSRSGPHYDRVRYTWRSGQVWFRFDR
jgi:hypothetical protein